MLATSKIWAIAIGFVVVAAAVTLAALRAPPREAAVASAPSLEAPPTSKASGSAGAARSSSLSTGQKEPVVVPMIGGPGASPSKEASTPQAAPVQAPGALSAPARPHFDVVRVEPSGETVVAGQGTPDTAIALLGEGRVLAETRTDAAGHFVLLPPSLKAGDHALTLRQTGEGPTAIESAQSVAVSVPARGRGGVVVALAEPGAATKVLSAPPAKSEPASRSLDGSLDVGGAPGKDRDAALPVGKALQASVAAPKDQPLVVRSVELENGSGFYATGAATPGSKLRVYLNNSHLTDVAVAADGQWSVKIRKGLTGGHYVVRADSSVDGTTVVARAEVPFDVPLTMADAAVGGKTPVALAAGPTPKPANDGPRQSVGAPVGASDPASSLPGAGAVAATGTPARALGPPVRDAARQPTPNAVVEEVSTASVRAGDNLWDISRARLGEGRRYTRIYTANMTQIRDPRLIYPGQVFVLPAAGD